MATRAHFVKKARKDYPDQGIKKGDSYWWWAFKFGPEHKSLTQPRPSQLTQSEFQSTYLAIGETLDDALQAAACKDDVEAAVEEAKSSIEQLRDEQEEKKSNMPDQLQEADSGQLLQERYDQLDEWFQSLDGIDYSELETAEENQTEAEANKEKPLEKDDRVVVVKDDSGYLDCTGVVEANPSPRNKEAVMVLMDNLDVSIDFAASDLEREVDEDDTSEEVENALSSLKDEISALDPGIG